MKAGFLKLTTVSAGVHGGFGIIMRLCDGVFSDQVVCRPGPPFPPFGPRNIQKSSDLLLFKRSKQFSVLNAIFIKGLAHLETEERGRESGRLAPECQHLTQRLVPGEVPCVILRLLTYTR